MTEDESFRTQQRMHMHIGMHSIVPIIIPVTANVIPTVSFPQEIIVCIIAIAATLVKFWKENSTIRPFCADRGRGSSETVKNSAAAKPAGAVPTGLYFRAALNAASTASLSGLTESST